MLSREEVIEIVEKFKQSKPVKFFNKFDDKEAGTKFVLIYLSEHNEEVYASTIADKMQISRARMAVLLQKLKSKNLIEKTPSQIDRRIEVLKITSKGLEEVIKFKETIISNTKHIIEQVGIEDINKFLEISKKIKTALEDIEGKGE